jgi:hypothetical protein
LLYRKEVLPLAASRDTSNSPDWKDLASILDSFQVQENVALTITLNVEVFSGVPDMWVTLVCTHQAGVGVEPVPSGYVRLRLSHTNRKTLDAALLAALYQLDFQLAAREYEGNKRTR